MKSMSSTTRSYSAPFTPTAMPEAMRNTRSRQLFSPTIGDRIPLLSVSSPSMNGTPENGTELFMASLPEASGYTTPPQSLRQNLSPFSSPDRGEASNRSTPSKYSVCSLAARHADALISFYTLNKIVVSSFKYELEKMFEIDDSEFVRFIHKIIDSYVISISNLSIQKNLNPLLKKQGDDTTLTLLNIFMVLNFEKIAKTTAFPEYPFTKVNLDANRLWDIFASSFNENMQELKSISVLHNTSINCSDVKRERGQLCGTLAITVSGVAGGLTGTITMGPIGVAIGSGIGMFAYTAASLGSRKLENNKENQKNTLEIKRLMKIFNHVELTPYVYSADALRVRLFEPESGFDSRSNLKEKERVKETPESSSNNILGVAYHPLESILL